MCGICGIVRSDPTAPVAEPVLHAMRESLTHRGPDDAGTYLGPGVGLANRRLSIVDLSRRGRMPMAGTDGRFWITYNGETYNYRDLRHWLIRRGHRLQSDTDTEVVLHLYEEEGPAMLPRLNGMFALAIWDSVERTLFMARDRLGVKPLIYAQRGQDFCFASEERALFAAGVPKLFDPSTLDELVCFRYVAGDSTPYLGVKRLLPGHWLQWKDGEIRVERWWNLSARALGLRDELPTGPVEWFRETFDNSVEIRRVSDVASGVLLSAGLDSAGIAASMAVGVGAGVPSFTVRFEEPHYDEGPVAQRIAERWQLEHHELTIPPDDLPALIDEGSRAGDGPIAHASDLHLLAMAKYAKARVTVLLSGEGADEALGGYVRYQPLRFPNLLALARPTLPHVISATHVNGRFRKLGRFLDLGTLDQYLLFSACEVLPSDMTAIRPVSLESMAYRTGVLEEARTLYPAEPARQAAYVDQHTFLCSLLHRNDRMTMAASVECRLPFLDYRLVEGLAALPSSELVSGFVTKRLMRRAIGHRLPDAVLKRPKWGFGVPWGHYLRTVPELDARVRALPDAEPFVSSGFDRAALRSVVDQFLGGIRDHDPLVTQLVMIASWYRVETQSAASSTRFDGPTS